MPEQIRTLNKYKENDAKRERDRVGQRQGYGVESTPGITYRQHLLLSVFQVTQIFVSRITGSTVDTMVTEAGTRLVDFPF